MRAYDMTSGSIWRALIRFSIPIMISDLVQATYNAVDMLFVGRFTGTESLAAVSVCGPIMNVMVITLSGMSAGVLVVISGLLGANNRTQAQDAAHTSASLYLLMASVTMIMGLIFVPQILRLVHTPAEAMPEAQKYLYTIFSGTFFLFGYNLIGALQRAQGNSMASMTIVIISSITNIVLDTIFIAYFDMGAFGAALGTICSQAAAFLIGLVQFIRSGSLLKISVKKIRIHKKHLLNILMFGVPTALNEVMVNIAMLTVSGVANTFGLAASAAYGVGARINSLAIFADGAMNQTMSTYASQNVGAEKKERALQGLWRAIMISVSISLVTAILVFFFAGSFASCFDNNPKVIESAVSFLHITVWSYPLFAAVGPLIGFIRGTGNIEASLLVGVIAQLCCRIPASFIFSRFMGFPGVGVAVLVGPLVSVSIYTWYIVTKRWYKGLKRVAKL